MGMPKIWNDSGLISTHDNDLRDGDLKVTGSEPPYTLQIRQEGAWVDFFPRLDDAGLVPPKCLPPPDTNAEFMALKADVEDLKRALKP
jgi:hypothetical protein